jgi:DNA-binding transcriptional LysR family regulator
MDRHGPLRAMHFLAAMHLEIRGFSLARNTLAQSAKSNGIFLHAKQCIELRSYRPPVVFVIFRRRCHLECRVIFWAFIVMRSNAFMWRFRCDLRMIVRMNIKHLTHIVAVAERGNFGRAAEHLNLSQPALSRSIQAAEAQLGIRLFDRGSAEVTLTPAGEFVLERARRLVFDSRCLRRDIELYRSHKIGDTAFGVGPFPADTFLAPLLIELRVSHPAVNLRVVVGNWALMLSQLRDETIEFFVADISDLPSDPDLLISPLRQELGGFYVRAGHPAAIAGSVSLKELWLYGVAGVRFSTPVRSALAKLLGARPNAAIRVAIECDNVEILKRVARVTDTVIAVTHVSVASDIEASTLVPVHVRGLPKLFADMGIVVMRGRSLSPMADLIVRRLPTLVATDKHSRND